MKTTEKTLKSVKDLINEGKSITRLSDFLSSEEIYELHERNKTKHIKPAFDAIDSYTAEIIARFGYDCYKDWEHGFIDGEQMKKWILAERARETATSMSLKGIIANGFGGCYQSKDQARASHRAIQKIVNEDIKVAKGEY